MKRGLYIFNFDDHPAANFIGTVKDARTDAPVAGAYVYFLNEYSTTRSTRAGAYEIPWFKDGVERVVAEAPGYFADTASVNISATGTTEWHFKLVSKTPVHVDESASLPEHFALAPIFPNPFSLSTHSEPLKIVYELTAFSNTELSIMNALGQQIKKLAARNQSPGKHFAYWSGLDEQGRKVSAGVYFIQLRVGRRVLQQKVTVVR